MKILITTAMYPTRENPAFGSFVRSQADVLRQTGVDVDVLVLNACPRKLLYPKGIFLLRRRLAADPSISLVHAHYGYVGMVARTQWKAPVVVTFHGDDLLGTVNHAGRTTPTSRVVAAAGRALGPLVDAVIVQSRQMAAKFNGLPNVYVLPHEIDFDMFRPVPKAQARALLGFESARKYLLFAANPDIAVKRFPLAMAAAEKLRDQDPSIELVVVHKEPQPRLALYMSACDVLVFPSYQEGSPNIVKQAMACNLPIVATDVGDVREVIGGTPGCHICPPDVSAFVHAIGQILTRCERTSGRDKVRHLDGPNVARQLIKVYEHVLSNNPSRLRVRTHSAA